MKHIKTGILFALFFYQPLIGLSQTMNWGNLKKSKQQFLSVHAGIEYGLIVGAGYGYQLRSKKPIILSADYSFTAGRILFDDFKTRIGGQLSLYQKKNFHLIAKGYSLFRRYESDLARLLNVGTDISVISGYYKRKWFLAGEAGFDKAIVTHFKHKNSYREIFPLVKDGWYEPATGGNFYYRLQAGYSFGRNDIYLEAGKIVNQDLQTSPLIPFSIRLGFSTRIRGKK